MKPGQLISVYDGDIVGWTTARLIEKLTEIDGNECWKMITSEGYELTRFVGSVEQYKPEFLMKPVMFKRSKTGKWETGTLYTYINKDTEEILSDDGEILSSWFKFKVNWS